MPHSRQILAGGHQLCVLGRRLLAYESDAFEQDLPVEGAELVQFWAEIRPELKAAIEALPADFGVEAR